MWISDGFRFVSNVSDKNLWIRFSLFYISEMILDINEISCVGGVIIEKYLFQMMIAEYLMPQVLKEIKYNFIFVALVSHLRVGV